MNGQKNPVDGTREVLGEQANIPKDISQTTDKVELEKLEQKKTLIQNAIDRFGQ